MHINLFGKKIQVIFWTRLGFPKVWQYPRSRKYPIFKSLYLGFMEIRWFQPVPTQEQIDEMNKLLEEKYK